MTDEQRAAFFRDLGSRHARRHTGQPFDHIDAYVYSTMGGFNSRHDVQERIVLFGNELPQELVKEIKTLEYDESTQMYS